MLLRRTSADASLLVRTATVAGRALGEWRRRRISAAQDAHIDLWKAAWTEGCNAGWDQVPETAVAYRSGAQRDAWRAGWAWAQQQPDRRDPTHPVTRVPDRRTSTRPNFLRAAQGGAIGLATLAAARWLFRSRAPRD